MNNEVQKGGRGADTFVVAFPQQIADHHAGEPLVVNKQDVDVIGLQALASIISLIVHHNCS